MRFEGNPAFAVSFQLLLNHYVKAADFFFSCNIHILQGGYCFIIEVQYKNMTVKHSLWYLNGIILYEYVLIVMLLLSRIRFFLDIVISNESLP